MKGKNKQCYRHLRVDYVKERDEVNDQDAGLGLVAKC